MKIIAVCSTNIKVASDEVVSYSRIGDLMDAISRGCKFDLICIDAEMDDCVSRAEQILQLDDNTTVLYIIGCKRNKQNKEVFYYYKRGSRYEILIDDIIYFESLGRNILMHLSDGSERFFSGKLNHVENQLLDKGMFSRIHQSYLINTRYIVKKGNRELIMEGEIRLPISRSRQK